MVVLAVRGVCTFGTKANATAAAAAGDGAATLIIVNDEPGNFHAPGPDAHDVDASVNVIPQQDGQALLAYLRNRESRATEEKPSGLAWCARAP